MKVSQVLVIVNLYGVVCIPSSSVIGYAFSIRISEVTSSKLMDKQVLPILFDPVCDKETCQ